MVFIKKILQLWFLGILFVLFILGYLFYSSIWVIRFMQTMKKTIWLFVSLLLISAVMISYYLLFPIGQQQESVELVIPRKASLRSVADSLQNKGVVTSSKALLLWLRITGYERKIQAGKVIFMRGEGVLSAARKLLHAEPIEITITIPEGLTIEQTAQRIAQVIPIDSVKFVHLCYDTTFIRKLNISHSTLEGYLFPETYRFPEEGVTCSDVIRKMVAQFDLAWSQLQPQQDITSRYSRHELVTLASIVEKEATVASERTRISAVFHNRLKLGYPLGADPTVRYALRKFSGPLRVSELNSSSPYNTRRFAGLPPGPICSPGRGALQAALAPADTKELYFVAKWDGSGEHDFSMTNEEHDRKKHAIRRENELRKKKKETRWKADSVQVK